MAAEELDVRGVESGSKQSLKRTLDDNLEDKPHLTESEFYKCPKRSRLDDQHNTDETVPAICESPTFNMTGKWLSM